MSRFQKKQVTYEEALEKLKHYCSFQDRCHQEVRDKLQSFNLSKEVMDEIIVKLIEERFLDEERFARNYVRGKFRNNEWGRLKIIQGLKQKGIHENLIQIALNEIEEDEYHKVLKKQLDKKWEQLGIERLNDKRHKVARFLIQKGFEQELVWQYLNDKD